MLKLKSPFVSKHYKLPLGISKPAKILFSLIRKSKRVLISSTLTSDGDSIGAQLAILELVKLLRRGKKTEIRMINQSPVPERYRFLKGSELISTTDEWQRRGENLAFDLGIVCDGGIERTGDVQKFFHGIPALALVDHHAIGSKLKYDARILDLESSSSCELVFHLFELAKLKIRPEIAEALYIGMVFDTGFFKHSLTTPRTHLVAAKLIETGIDFSKICDRALLDRSWKAQLLLRKLMLNLEERLDRRLISSFWSKRDLEEIQPEDGDQEGMINQLYYTETADVVVLLVEKSDEVKVSFRSKGKVNVAELARKLNPQGGGHVRASGCTLNGSLHEVRERVLRETTTAINEVGLATKNPHF